MELAAVVAAVRALPSWARSLSGFVNGTHLRIGGPGAENFSGYSTRIVNWGVSYARANFAVKVNVTNSNGPRNATVAANATTPAGTYTPGSRLGRWSADHSSTV